ncbi:hypothetical protein SANT12839_046170 [Streptomyces antimycoticus]|uniref:Uncharacterized protein n=1 Tax=Streptomyces antimycoticus TaxID=68175 RepID=A0A4D4K452_9ACTN|nr:hypothetical protein SANT12839_046170 [Streptomyces antimycoticus]
MGDEDVVEDAADREAYRGDRWMGTHVRFPSVIRGGASGVRGVTRRFVTLRMSMVTEASCSPSIARLPVANGPSDE